MGLLKIFKGGIKLGAGLKPKGDFPLMEAHDIVADEVTDKDGNLKGIRLDDKLQSIEDDVKALKEKPSGGSVYISYDSENEILTINQEEHQNE